MVGIWLEGGEEKKLMGPGSSLPGPTKMFSSQNGKKTKRKTLTLWSRQNTHMYIRAHGFVILLPVLVYCVVIKKKILSICFAFFFFLLHFFVFGFWFLVFFFVFCVPFPVLLIILLLLLLLLLLLFFVLIFLWLVLL